MKRVNVLGVGISVLTLDLALRAVADALAEKRKGYVCVTNVHSVMEAQHDKALRRILNHSFLTTPDGMPMVWMGKLCGFLEIGRVYGPDLMREVCEFTRGNDFTHFLYGGADGVAQQLKASLEEKFPGIKIVGTYTPPFRALTAAEETELIRAVAETKPDIIWVGLGAPKQEKFMADYLPKLDTTLMFGVGAAFDFYTGRVRQAPRWIQRSGLEWLFRLCCEPRRLWRRYLKNNPLFLLKIFCQLTGLKKYSIEE